MLLKLLPYLLNEAAREEVVFGEPGAWQFLCSFPPGLADLHPMKLDSSRVVGTEVGFSLVQSSPFCSWTRGPWSTSPCRHGP